jgi:hypothetical protein
MNYYILPKNNNIFDIDPSLQKTMLNPYTSHSLYYSYKKLIKENVFLFESKIYEDIIKIINPYEFIFSKIPGTKLSVSKIPFHSNIFYDFLEIINTLNLIESFQNKTIKTLHITPNYESTIESIEILRENIVDTHTGKINLNLKDNIEDTFDFIFYELKNNFNNNTNINEYTLDFLNILKIILKSQINNGSCIIKISMLFHKPIIDIIYILSSLYEKIYIIKPNTSNIISYDKYIVCKTFILNEKVSTHYEKYYNQIVDFLNKSYLSNLHNPNSLSFIRNIIKNELPCYFINKIDDINIITGQQQLEYTNQLINILKNKNRDIKLENIKKINIQKCIQWCEKYNIPCNKYIEKSNIFLTNNTSENEEEMYKIN